MRELHKVEIVQVNGGLAQMFDRLNQAIAIACTLSALGAITIGAGVCFYFYKSKNVNRV